MVNPGSKCGGILYRDVRNNEMNDVASLNVAKLAQKGIMMTFCQNKFPRMTTA